MRNRLKLSLRFDAAAMRRDLLRLEATDWIDHFVQQNYEGAWQVLPFRAPASASHPIQTIYSDPACETFVDTPLLARCPYFQEVMAAFQCPLLAVRLMKLTPGSTIKPHADLDLSAESETARFHVPVLTNPDVDFRLNGEHVTLREGECWYLRLSDTHSVANRGSNDRIHLVLDARVTPWLQDRLLEADRATDSEEVTDVPSNPESDLDRFRRRVLQDSLLQQKLRDVEDRDTFIALAIQLALENGCRTTAGEIDESMRRTRRRWTEPLS